MKLQYEKPLISRQRGGAANKFAGFIRQNHENTIEGIKTAELLHQYGSPLYVFSEKTIKHKYSELTNAFSFRYPRVQHAWSYKTNYLQGICKTLHPLGSWAEVVSPMEYDMARRLNVPGSHIVFNGPYKPYDGLKRAAIDRALINIDSLDELEDIEKISIELGRPISIGIRLNMSLGTQMSWDRYGFNIESGFAETIIKRCVSSRSVIVTGLHAHIGTFVYESMHYRTAITKMIGFAKKMQSKYGLRFDYIDIGGGFASKNRLKTTYAGTTDAQGIFDHYAEAICEPLLDAFNGGDLPLLLLESGRSVIDEAGTIITTITSTKRLNNGMRGLVIDAGVNLLFTAFWYDHDVIPTIDRGSATENHVIYGPLCMQIDVIRENIKLPPLEKGDSVLIRPAGAYNNTQWLQFINPRPAVIMIGEDGQIAMLRKAETVDYLQQGEQIPKWLNN
ncbi:MAG: diaminopimelate decarboxylase [Bdellovibrionota bacterium]